MKFRIIFGLLAVAFVASSPVMASSSSEGEEMIGAMATSNNITASDDKDDSTAYNGISNTTDGEGQEFAYNHYLEKKSEIKGSPSSIPSGIKNFSEGEGQEYMGS